MKINYNRGGCVARKCYRLPALVDTRRSKSTEDNGTAAPEGPAEPSTPEKYKSKGKSKLKPVKPSTAQNYPDPLKAPPQPTFVKTYTWNIEDFFKSCVDRSLDLAELKPSQLRSVATPFLMNPPGSGK